MQVIKCLSESIENTLDAAEDAIKKAIMYKEDFPVASRAFYNKSTILMDSIKPEHDAVVALIEGYNKEKGNPPEAMLAIYNYVHERQINKSVAIKLLQEMYAK